MFKLFLSVLLFKMVLSALVVPEEKRSLKKCVKKILTDFIGTDTTVLHVYNTSGTAPLSYPMMNPIINFDVGKVTFKKNNYKFYSDVVIIDAKKFFLRIWNTLRASSMWTINNLNKRKFIIILPIEATYQIPDVFRFLWNYDIVNTFIIAYDLKLEQDVTWLFTSDPMDPKNGCGYAAKQIYRRQCDEVSISPLLKMSTKYNNCLMHYIYTDKSEFEETASPTVFLSLYILDIIEEVLNTTIVFKLHDELNNGKYFIYTYTFQLSNMISYTLPYIRDDFVWIVPPPSRIHSLEVFKINFKTTVWIFILMAFIITSLAWWLIAKCEHASDLVSVMLQIYSATLYSFINRTPSFLPLRWIFIAYVIYAIHIQSIFVSNLVRLLTVPQYEDAINNLDELVDSNIPIIVDELMVNLFKDIDNEDTLYNKIKRNLIEVTHDVYERSVFSNSAVMVKNHSILTSRNLLNQAILINNVKFEYFADNVLFGQCSSILQTRPGSSIHHLIQKIIDNLLEFGLMDHETTIYERTLKNHTRYIDNSVNPKVEDKVVLTLDHVYPIFVFWGAGMIISTVVFFVELLKHRVDEKRNGD